jgi:carbon monoxide dehydrogenase subunit G
MPRAYEKIVINADRDTVWRLLTTPADIPKWYAGIDGLTASDQYPAVGSSFDWRTRLAVIDLKGKNTVIESSPGELIRYRLSGMLEGTWTWRISEVAGRLLVESDADYHLTGGLAARMVEPAVHQINVANAKKSLESLKQLAED